VHSAEVLDHRSASRRSVRPRFPRTLPRRDGKHTDEKRGHRHTPRLTRRRERHTDCQSAASAAALESSSGLKVVHPTLSDSERRRDRPPNTLSLRYILRSPDTRLRACMSGSALVTAPNLHRVTSGLSRFSAFGLVARCNFEKIDIPGAGRRTPIASVSQFVAWRSVSVGSVARCFNGTHERLSNYSCRRSGACFKRPAHTVLRQERRISLEVGSARSGTMRETIERRLRERR
jgi:hypothetical protein